MRKAQQSLSAIVNAGPDAAQKETGETLSRAFDATAPGAAEELRDFISAVRKWLEVREEKTLLLWRWVEAQVDSWLHRIDATTVDALAATMPTLPDRIRLLEVFFGTPLRSSLGKALQAAAKALAELPSQDVTPEEQVQRGTFALKLVDMAAVAAVHRDVTGLAQVLSLLPDSLLEQVFAQAGRLGYFDFYLEELARALPMTEPHVTEAFAASFSHKESLRLRRLLEELATHARRPAVPHLPNPPARSEVERWFINLRRAVGRRSAELQRRVEAFTTAHLNHERELSTILAAYLNARPANHEDVFDLFSAHSERRREGFPPSVWGRPSVMTWSSGSMRSGSIATGRPSKTRLDPADFDWQPALRAVSEPVLREFILGQESPEFALAYLAHIRQVDHPDFETLCTNLAASRVFSDRLRVSTGVMSAVVLRKLYHLRYSVPLKDLYRQLMPELLPEVPAEYLSNIIESVRFFEEGLEQPIEQDLDRRFPRAADVTELEDLLNGALTVFTASEVVARFLDKVPFDKLVPGEGTEDAQLEEWLNVVAQLSNCLDGEPAQRLLSRLPPSLFGRMYLLPLMGPLKHDMRGFIDSRQALKCLFIEAWARHGCVPVHEALQQHIERDFELWWRCRFPEDAKQLVASTAFRWLHVVAGHCPEALPTYLRTLLQYAWTVRHHDEYGPYIEAAAKLVGAWLHLVSRTAGMQLWRILLARLEALPEDDYEGAAALAAVELPAAPGELASFRARAVPEVQKRVLAASSVSMGDSLGRLRQRLAKDSPELETQLWLKRRRR